MAKLYAMIYTLGCRVNSCESFSLADRLKEYGFEILPANSEKTPDAVFVNTCAVTAESSRKSGQIVRRFRQKYPDAFIAVAGCYAQSGVNIPQADAVFGNSDKDEIASVISKLSRPSTQIYKVGKMADEKKCSNAIYSTKYLDRCHIKIEDGCDSRCAYCIIPTLRGSVRSKDPAVLINELESRVSEGNREILLTGIETGSYGKDLDGISLADILEKADRIPGIYIIRLGSMDPFCFTDGFIARLAALSHFEHHIHLSVQSGCSETLAAMRRKYNAEFLRSVVEKLYAAIPDICLTADVIVGFPGETEEHFKKTCEFARRANFLHMHIFPYSERKGTAAAEMGGSVPKDVRKRRAAELEKINEECKLKNLERAVGTVQTVHFETKKGNFNTGYTGNYMPVRLPCKKDLHGEILSVKITGINPDFTLKAELEE